MRLLSTLLTLSLVGLASAAPVFEEDFETGAGSVPANWSFAQQRGVCAGAWDATEPPPSGRSIRLDITDDPTARATWTYRPRIEVKPSTAYRLTVRVLLADVDPSAKAYVILYENGLEDPAHWHHTPFWAGSRDWHTYTLDFTTGPEATWLRLQCKLWEGTGHAWFDHLKLEELAPGQAPKQMTQRKPPPDDGSPLQMWWYPAQRRPDNTLYLLGKHLNPLGVFFWGRKEEIKDPYLLLEAPKGVAVRGPVVRGRSPLPDAVDVRPEPVERDGRRLLRWRLPLPLEPLLMGLKLDGPNWTEYHYVYVEPEESCPAEFSWRWQLEVAGNPGPVHEIPARVVTPVGGALAPVPGFDLYAQHSGALRYPSAEGRAQVLDYLAYAGIRGGLSLTYYQPEYVDIDRELNQAGFFTWAWHWDGYGGRGEADQRLVYQDGTTATGLLCPQFEAERGEPWFSDLVSLYRSRLATGLKTIIINYEPPYLNCCYCARCRSAFARFAGLDEAKVASMTPAEIRALPDNAWGRFRSEQNGRIVKNHVAALRQVASNIRVGICGPPYHPSVADSGMDIRLFEPDVAIHAPMIYTVGLPYEQMIRSTCEGTTSMVLPFLLVSDVVVGDPFPLPEDVRVNMLATALSGARGAFLWVGIEALDGQYLQALRQSMEEIRLLEPYILDGTRDSEVRVEASPGRSRLVRVGDKEIRVTEENPVTAVRTWTWRSSRGRLLGLINYDRETAHQVGVLAEGVTEAKTLYGPAPKVAEKRFLIELAPYQAAAYVW